MDTFTGRRSAAGIWCAWGLYSELARAASTGEVVEVTMPSRAVSRVRITRVGKSWQHPSGAVVAYGYLEDAAAEPTVTGWVA